MIVDVVIGQRYLHLPSGKTGTATTFSPPLRSCDTRGRWTILSPAGVQFGPGPERNFTAYFSDLVLLCDIPDLQRSDDVRAWLDA